MSANNYILINRKKFDISLRDADTGELLSKIGKANTLDKAIDIAQRYQNSEIVEYGIKFTENNLNK
ncbi:MAG: hypothetical protein AAB768_03985 [Patescibacteria group bacterium]